MNKTGCRGKRAVHAKYPKILPLIGHGNYTKLQNKRGTVGIRKNKHHTEDQCLELEVAVRTHKSFSQGTS